MTTTATAITAPTMSQILPVRLLQSTTREASSLPSHLARVASPRQERGIHPSLHVSARTTRSDPQGPTASTTAGGECREGRGTRRRVRR